MPLAINAVPNPEVHNGLAIQMIDEVRHSTIQMNLKRLYMNHYIDPAGFDITEKAFSNCYAGTIGRQFGEGFITGDAITAANVYLTIVAETAFTNVLFVAMPGEAAANGDYLLPTVFHSVQSDESRHISNGYSIILMALADERNRQLLERDLRYAWWNNHRVVDAAIGTFIEYGTKDRRKDRDSYAESWRRWIYDDYYRSYLMPLEKYGLTIPHDLVEEAWDRSCNKGYVHEVAQFFATGWFANYWRIDAMDDTDFEWFEHKYPGWYDKYGKWWERYADYSVKNGHKPIAFEAGCPTTSIRTAAGRAWCRASSARTWSSTRSTARCAPTARRPATGPTPSRSAPSTRGAPTPSMGKLSGKREWETLYHGMDVAEIMQDLGLRARRRQHAHPAAAPGPRPEEDVDARRGPRHHAQQPERDCSTRCRPRSARSTSRTTRPAAPPAGPAKEGAAVLIACLRRRRTRRAGPAAVRLAVRRGTRSWARSTSHGSSRSASSWRSTRTRRSSTPPSGRASCSCTAARRGSARPASRSCSTARSTSIATRRSRCPISRRPRATRCCAGRTP